MRSVSPSLAPAKKKGNSSGGGSSSRRAQSPCMQEPGSPSAEDAAPTGKQAKKSAGASPSMLGLSPMQGPDGTVDLPPTMELPPALGDAEAYHGKIPVPAPVPSSPPNFNSASITSEETGIGLDEMYSQDERLLNEFLKLHPMLSNEATSQRTLQSLAGMFEKASLKSADLPVVSKSHDDQFLSPANEAIGERPCINGANCLAQHVAKMRYGVDTTMAFTCKEFLLPAQKQQFLEGGGVPQRRGKCLLCTRYYQNYTYIIARTDPAFKVGETPVGLQVFCNPVTNVPPAAGGASGSGLSSTRDYRNNDEAQLREAAAQLPTHASIVSARDGYRPEAMLFVDEDWAALRSAREGNLGKLLWRPVVRFSSGHYQYVKDSDGLRIVQVGIGADADADGLHFQRPVASTGAPPPAGKREAVSVR